MLFIVCHLCIFMIALKWICWFNEIIWLVSSKKSQDTNFKLSKKATKLDKINARVLHYDGLNCHCFHLLNKKKTLGHSGAFSHSWNSSHAEKISFRKWRKIKKTWFIHHLLIVNVDQPTVGIHSSNFKKKRRSTVWAIWFVTFALFYYHFPLAEIELGPWLWLSLCLVVHLSTRSKIAIIISFPLNVCTLTKAQK